MKAELLVPAGRTLLLAAFGWTLLQSIRGRSDLQQPFERLVIGMLALSYYDTAAIWLDAVSAQLSASVMSMGRETDLKTLLLNAMQQASSAPTNSGGHTAFNLPAVLEQAWRAGVWGVMSAVVDGVFLVISFLLECTRDVLWQFLLLLFPLGAGLYPVFPHLMGGLSLYALELSLWTPALCLVERITGEVAKTHLTEMGSLGLSIVGIELVAIVLILSIPTVIHHFLRGALSGDFGTQASAIGWARSAIIDGRTQLVRNPTEAA